jgi:hypothetical protein
MSNFAIAAVFSLGLLLQGIAYVANPPPGVQVSLAAAQPHQVSGAPVLLAAITTPRVAPGISPYRQAGAASLITSPFFGAGQMLFFGG